MMFPYLLKFEGLIVPWYFFGLGLFTSLYIFFFYIFLGKKYGWKFSIEVGVISLFFAFVGSKIGVYILTDKFTLKGDTFWFSVAIGGGLTFLYVLLRRGLIGAIEVLDDATLPASIGYTAYRLLVCLPVGCCYGKPWESGISFKPGSSAYSHFGNYPLYPTQIMEAVNGLIIFFSILVYSIRKEKRVGGGENSDESRKLGTKIYIFFSLYAILRFITEFFRGDISTNFYVMKIPFVNKFSPFYAIDIWQVIGICASILAFVSIWILNCFIDLKEKKKIMKEGEKLMQA